MSCARQAKPKTKRGRPPVIDIDVAFNLKAEVTEEKQKGGLRKKEAIANLIEDDAPHSWWWDKNAPIKPDAADRRYHRAVKLLENYEREHGQAYEPMSLAKLGERAGIKPPEQPPRTIRQISEDNLDYKRWLYENKGDDVAIPAPRLQEELPQIGAPVCQASQGVREKHWQEDCHGRAESSA